MANKFLGIVGPQVTLYGQVARPQPPMGLAYVMNSVVQAGWEPEIFDSLAEGAETYIENASEGIRVTGLDSEQVLKKITEIKPDLIGVTLAKLLPGS